MAVLRNDGYETPASPLISSSALGSLLLAPFGCHGLNLAAITAAICTGRESHENPSALRRRSVGWRLLPGAGHLRGDAGFDLQRIPRRIDRRAGRPGAARGHRWGIERGNGRALRP